MLTYSRNVLYRGYGYGRSGSTRSPCLYLQEFIENSKKQQTLYSAKGCCFFSVEIHTIRLCPIFWASVVTVIIVTLNLVRTCIGCCIRMYDLSNCIRAPRFRFSIMVCISLSLLFRFVVFLFFIIFCSVVFFVYIFIFYVFLGRVSLVF